MQLYNSLTRKKEEFAPLHPPQVGLYVCGPTVYGDPHLGHARTAIVFDVLFRYLQKQGYAVRYVRNITDVGHLENDADEGEDKVAKRARLQQIEPMEVAQRCIRSYHSAMQALGTLPPSIEPQASGHIIEQVGIILKIMEAGFAYRSPEGSVYFDVEKYDLAHGYGRLSGRTLDDLKANTRTLEGQSQKRGAYDFALWKNAQPQHIMRWGTPLGLGFPGWHIECSAMSVKYLGERFDIHGGGMDLLFPHHDCEIAQNMAAFGSIGAQLWMHSNMITLNKQKMGKSLGNAITLDELFTGAHPLLEQAYSPMAVRFFILQAHYRSTLDFSNEALQAAEKGLRRLLEAKKILDTKYTGADAPSAALPAVHADAIAQISRKCYAALDDDLNAPVAIAHLFDAVHLVNAVQDGKAQPFSPSEAEALRQLFNDVGADILGLQSSADEAGNAGLLDGVMTLLLALRTQAKADKNFALSDSIRTSLARLGISVKDGREGSTWEAEN